MEALERRVAELERPSARTPAAATPGFPTGRGACASAAAPVPATSGAAICRRGLGRVPDLDARLFVDAELARDVEVADATVVRTIGTTLEWDLVRIGELQNQVGELYVDFQGLADSSWLNAQVGRFQIPLGENYLRFSKGYRDNPFISNTVGGPWWWDEGVRVYGQESRGRFGYVASISNGDTNFNTDNKPIRRARSICSRSVALAAPLRERARVR